MEDIIKLIENTYNTELINKIELINVIVIKFKNGITIDIPLNIINNNKD